MIEVALYKYLNTQPFDKPLVLDTITVKAFFQYLIELVQHTHGSLGIARKDMPQIKEVDIPHFLKRLESEGAIVTDLQLPVNKLFPTQKEINPERVKDKINTSNRKPLIISKDYYILDGHHQWMAMRIEDAFQLVDVHMVNMKMDELLRFARAYERTSFKNINGEVE
jgi:hypothetical protein